MTPHQPLGHGEGRGRADAFLGRATTRRKRAEKRFHGYAAQPFSITATEGTFQSLTSFYINYFNQIKAEIYFFSLLLKIIVHLRSIISHLCIINKPQMMYLNTFEDLLSVTAALWLFLMVTGDKMGNNKISQGISGEPRSEMSLSHGSIVDQMSTRRSKFRKASADSFYLRQVYRRKRALTRLRKIIRDVLSTTVVHYSEMRLLGKTEARPSKWLQRDDSWRSAADPQAPSAGDFRFHISYDIPARLVSGISNQDCGVIPDEPVDYMQQNPASISSTCRGNGCLEVCFRFAFRRPQAGTFRHPSTTRVW